MREQQTWLVNIDIPTLGLFLGLVAIGWTNIYSVTYTGELVNDFRGFLASPIGKQTIWIGISILVFGVVFLFLDWRFWQSSAYIFYGLSIALLLAVLVLGTEINGARSWFRLAGMTFQPSEVAKFGTCLAMAAFLSHWNHGLNKLTNQLVAFGIFLVPVILILLQPDAGSALVFLGMLLVLYREGMPVGIYIIGIFTGVLLILGILYQPWYLVLILFALAYFLQAYYLPKNRTWIIFGLLLAGLVYYLHWHQEISLQILVIGLSALLIVLSIFQYSKGKPRFIGLTLAMLLYGSSLAFAANYAFNEVLKPHQRERINVWLKPQDADASGAAYNVMNSKYAIASGGLMGKGWGEGNVTKGRFVPMQSTDFIFCTVGEEHGFIGAAILIILFISLLIRLIYIAERQRFAFSRIYAYGVTGILFIHFLVNIGMTMGLMPVIGIPLPFISKGGSSLLGFTIMIAVLLKMDKHRKQRIKVRNFGV